MNLAHLVMLTMVVMGAGVALAATRMAGVLQPQDVLSYDTVILMSGLMYMPAVVMFGILFWRERYVLYLAGTLMSVFFMVFTPVFLSAMGG